MSMFNDVMVVEGAEEADSAESFACSVQRMINAGNWSLQGSFGRTMMDMIRSGQCMLGTSSAQDYWGNTIPSRDDVTDGTKGSRQFVVDAMGEEWAAMLEAL
jgi:hypothetical protein